MNSSPEPPETARDLARTVLVHGPLARRAVAERLGLSMASLTRLSRPLLDGGLFVEGPLVNDGQVGRPARLLDVRAGARHFIGVKLTGGDASAVLTDLRTRELASETLPLAGTTPEQVLETVEELCRRLRERLAPDAAPVAAVGISLGGNVDAGGVVLRAPFLGWRNVQFAGPAAARLGVPVVLENDVVALTAAEQWFGAGRGADSFAVLTIGAGVGYGLVVHDRVINTPDSGLGLGGHYPLDPNGPLCVDGHRGCSTAMLSIRSICAQVAAVVDGPVDYPRVLELVRAGHPAATAVAVAAGRALGRMMAAVANLAMLNRIVLSGEGLGIISLVRDELDAALAADRDPDAAEVQVFLDDSGFTQWARGAAAVAIQHMVLNG